MQESKKLKKNIQNLQKKIEDLEKTNIKLKQSDPYLKNFKKSQSIWSKLRGYFNIGVKHTKNTSEVIPVDVDTKTKIKTEVSFPSDLQKFYDFWLNECHDNTETLKNRFDRYDDLDYMVYNDTVISMAVEMYADEATQADSQSQVIKCDAEDDKVESYIIDFLERIGYTVDVIKEIIRNMVQYGDGFCVNSLDEKKGFTDTSPIDVRSVKDRIEFSLLHEQRKWFTKQARVMAKSDLRMKSLLDVLADKELSAKKSGDYSKLYKPYLFGFRLEGDLYVPPWSISHFRLYSSDSEFYPYGRPLFIHNISPFRQLKAAKNLMAFARMANIPKEIFSIKTGDTMTQAERWTAIDAFIEQYNNLGLTSTVKNDMGVGSRIYLPQELADFNVLTPNIDLDSIADIELLRDDMILGTRIPKGYLIVDSGGWGASGQALLQQFKPFGRAVFTLQSTFLKEITHLIKMHFMVAGLFDGENTNFELSMNFPVTEESKDRIDLKNDTFRLATDIISGIADSLGLQDGLPSDVVKSIFKSLSFLDDESIETWINKSSQINDTQNNPLINDNPEQYEENSKSKINTRLNEQIIKSAYIRARKKNRINEGVRDNRHYVASWSKNKHYEDIYNLFKLSQREELKD